MEMFNLLLGMSLSVLFPIKVRCVSRDSIQNLN